MLINTPKRNLNRVTHLTTLKGSSCMYTCTLHSCINCELWSSLGNDDDNGIISTLLLHTQHHLGFPLELCLNFIQVSFCDNYIMTSMMIRFELAQYYTGLKPLKYGMGKENHTLHSKLKVYFFFHPLDWELRNVSPKFFLLIIWLIILQYVVAWWLSGLCIWHMLRILHGLL